MKWKPDKNQTRWGVTVFLTSACVLLFYYLLFHGSRISSGLSSLIDSLMAIVYGVVIAYVLAPVEHFFEKRLFMSRCKKKGIDYYAPEYEKQRRKTRKICISMTMALFILILYTLLWIIVPQLISSIQSFVKGFPTYIDNITRVSNTYFFDHPEVAATIDSYLDQASDWMTDFVNNTVMPQATVMIRRLSLSLVNFVRGVFNFIIGMIIAVYLLNSKEHFKSSAKKFIYAFFKEEFANELVAGGRYAHYTFSGFIVGKLVDSLIIGVLCYIGAFLLKTPYPVLVAVIVGVTNIIPFFGPYIGEIATFILLILINPLRAVIFLAFLIILQQIDGNIIGPKILGNSTGLSSFWVIFSVLFFGSLFGVTGWILGVPIFAVIYALVSRITNILLSKKKLPTDTEIYGDTAYVEKGKVVLKKDADWDLYHVRHPQSIWRRIFRIREQVGEKISGVMRPVPEKQPEQPDQNNEQSDIEK